MENYGRPVRNDRVLQTVAIQTSEIAFKLFEPHMAPAWEAQQGI